MEPSEPSAIEPATVSLVLSYISPLDAPLPPHLISKPLLQRHHFLAVSIENPAEYLAWPSHDSQDAVTLLLAKAPLEHPHDLRLAIRYLADAESLQAHVSPITTDSTPDPGFRLIFLWDPTNGWQYHNIALMPFPRDSYPTIPDAMAAFRSPHDFLAEPTYAVTVATPDDDDDAYWNSYGQDPEDVGHDPGANKAQADLNTEDAYWARYSSVHGTADSTIPSPLPVKRNADGTQVAQSERIFIPSSSLRPDHDDEDDEPYNPLQPPSPDALSRRLARLAVRPDSPLEDENSSEDSDALPSPDRTHPEAELDQSPLGESQPAAPDRLASVESQQFVVIDQPQTNAQEQGVDGDAALQQSIQGLYRLWKLQQQSKSQDADKETFLTLVRRAIELP